MGLSNRWVSLCENFRIEPVKRDLVFKIIMERYTRLGRYYHTPKHIKHCLEELDEIRDKGFEINIDLIEMAIWFHDFYYESNEKQNELKSVQAFRGILGQYFSVEQRIEIEVIILDTVHNGIVHSLNSQYMTDIDLSSLGYDEGRFNRYWKLIRQEYSWVSDDNFIKGRLEILNKIASREYIYYTDYFKNKYEKQARRNIEIWNKKLG